MQYNTTPLLKFEHKKTIMEWYSWHMIMNIFIYTHKMVGPKGKELYYTS
jgi:hypothetical protein